MWRRLRNRHSPQCCCCSWVHARSLMRIGGRGGRCGVGDVGRLQNERTAVRNGENAADAASLIELPSHRTSRERAVAVDRSAVLRNRVSCGVNVTGHGRFRESRRRFLDLLEFRCTVGERPQYDRIRAGSRQSHPISPRLREDAGTAAAR